MVCFGINQRGVAAKHANSRLQSCEIILSALVMELTNSGSYQGQTILTLPQAYIDARLVCRLTGDWLNPTSISELYQEYEEQPED